MNNHTLNIIILAAGKGTRMQFDHPKLLHLLGGKPILEHVINLAQSLCPKTITVIYNKQYKKFKIKNKNNSITWIKQKKILGTGNAISQIINNYKDHENILILYGDVPLISKNSIQKMLLKKKNSTITLLTAKLNNPEEYGRIIRKNKKIVKIIEYKDATDEQLNIKEVNSGILIVSSTNLKKWIFQIHAKNNQNEYYITDIISLANKDNHKINSVRPEKNDEIQGINNLLQLVRAEKIYQKQQAKLLLLSGIMIYNPSNFSLRGTLKHGKNIKIDHGVILEGSVKIGNSVIIEPGCIIKNSTIGNNCTIKAYSIIEKTIISNKCIVGPFTHLQHGTVLKNNTHVGNFVEIKKTTLGSYSKAKHLSYLGNSQIGQKVNIGAGTVTCNYNGKKKLDTIIGDNVFIGSSTQLIAPINIKKGTIIAAGTTVMKNIHEPSLVYNEKKQIHKKL
ncbi:UDP-N-acetylglucosamine pyrophosphorylase [Buchnera aphidicola str. Bp (Baizongia pistaciae)]|uniref:Bifunctional protein GlmU n=1 Tax=Buchnera aphidicola subsp. Baizongia pistaciae (strain Bp) TaxID=224915 RepID=GLMU_BUCBP|nr:bifunctional UDP-N-acetylglucosamine diphosphorylase/glucosamine-1-phosphate N-acetyltransferase GlmU [Buchnera aphidicola]Q89B26.1 RecName: Full=Bifunctional protein GlmU; Includes: RecName: Full=UDP-N-acetylglucosamine pyrophosphorylase; AltName: Full=N-acetylglucosamine-1-phosphate uridyltransferase; Includes: RecName: Full=Glucosamine-1-phosphate N-acetyltransferase [Buchnera aphidicola str. Bp (Baizongia pistaciae)]AAO26772.1 UDP-N-acetylglucosamine pyrophosphorylase [Buchnera aphidicola 